ncbi:MAG: peptidylprolyl isomerase [Campylobacterota bacterium]|nr:peptidylprolyl isomerase [Campylobacterota bacterium]
MKKTALSFVASLVIASSTFALDNKVYATVNGDEITSSDIAVILRNPNLKFESIPKEQQKQVLDSLIEQKLLSQKAMKSNIVNTDEYKNELNKLKQTLAFQIWMRDLSKNIKIDEKDLKTFYNQNRSKYIAKAQLKASHILVKTEQEAKELIKKLEVSKNIKQTFTQLAKDKSTGPSGVNGGELGWFTKDRMVPEFSDSADKLAKGEFTKKAVKTQFGYHIIYLDDKKNSTTQSFDSVKNKITQEYSQKVFYDMIKTEAQKLKTKAKIEYK